MIRNLIARLFRRAEDYAAEHVGATLADGIGIIPPERTVAEIAADGASALDELAAIVDRWNGIDYQQWVLDRAQATHRSTHTRGMRAEARCERVVDRALRKFGSSLALVAAEKLLAACHGDLSEMAEKAERPVAIDDTYQWTNEDQADYDALCESEVAA